MTALLEASEQPITDMLEDGVAFVPGFFDDTIDALDEASLLLNSALEESHSHDYNFGSINNYPDSHALSRIGQKIIQLANSSKEVEHGIIPPMHELPGMTGRKFDPDDHIDWHRDNPLHGTWAIGLAVLNGSGVTEVGSATPLLGRRHPRVIESNKSDLILLRGRFVHGHAVPYARTRVLHRAHASSKGREILANF